MYYSCRSYIGAYGTPFWSEYWENEKTSHLFGLISSGADISSNRQIINNINQNYTVSLKDALKFAGTSRVGLMMVNGDKAFFIATTGIFIAVKRDDKLSFFAPLPGLVISGNLKNLDRFVISNSRDFIKSVVDQPLNAEIDIPENISAAVIEIHQDQAAPSPQYISHSPTHQVRRRRHYHVFVIILLLISLLVGSYFINSKNKKQKLATDRQNLISRLDQDISKKDLSSAQTSFTELQTFKIDQELLDKYSAAIKKLQNPLEAFYDTKLINEKAVYSKIIFNNNNLILLDSTNSRLDQLSILKSKKELSTSATIKSISDIAIDKDKIYGLSSDKIYLLNGIEFDEVEALTTPALDFQSWNGSVYVLLPDTIKKLNSSTPWLASDEILTSPTSIAINGKIWVLSANGKLTPYFRGKKDKFVPSEKLSLQNAKNLLTSPSTEDLVFSADDTIYVFEKTGNLKLKKTLENIKILDIAADFGQKSIYILASDQQIYKIDLP